MKKLIYIIMMLMPFSILAQKADSGKATLISKLKIGFILAPEYSYRTLSPDPSYSSQFITGSRNSMEVYKIGYETGIGAVYNFNKKVGVSLGATFSDKGYETNTYVLNYNGTNPVRGFTYTGPSPSGVSYIYNYYYLDIPLKVYYCFNRKKNHFYVFTGISANFQLVDYTNEHESYSDGSTANNTYKVNYSFSSIDYQAIGGVGLSFDMAKRFAMTIEPEANYSINSITQAPIREYLYSFGLNIEIYWKFCKIQSPN